MDVLVLDHGRDQSEQEKDLVHTREHADDRPPGQRELALGGEEAVRERPDDEVGAVDEYGQKREHHARRDSHKHVIGGEAAVGDAAHKVASVGEEDLIEALGPPHALDPGGLEGERLLVEELGRHKADLDAVGGAEGGELDVLRERVEVPAVHAADDGRRDHPSRARDRTARVGHHAGIVEELGLADEPDGIGGRNPARVEVLGVAIRRADQISRVEGIVHLAGVVGRDDVVRIEDEEGLVPVAVFVEDAVEAIVHDPALALAGQVVAVPDDGTGGLCLGMCVVRAGVAHDEDVHQLARVVLFEDRADEVADDRLFVVGRDEEGIAMELLCGRQLDHTAEDAHQHVDALVEIGDREEGTDYEIENDDRRETHVVKGKLHVCPSWSRFAPSKRIAPSSRAAGKSRPPPPCALRSARATPLVYREGRAGACRPARWTPPSRDGQMRCARSGGTGA